MGQTLTLSDLREMKASGVTTEEVSNLANGPYPLQDEAEEQILAAIGMRIGSRMVPGGALEELKAVLTGEKDDDAVRLPACWLIDGDVREVAGGSTFGAMQLEMDLVLRVAYDYERDATTGQTLARRLATRVREQVIRDDAGNVDRRLGGLGFVTNVRFWQSRRAGEVAEGVWGHQQGVRIRFFARE